MSDESDVTSTDAEAMGGDPAADQAAEIEAAMAEARARLSSVPAEVVVTNHVMGLYELGAIHLSAEQPDLVSASLAIDSMAMLVEGLGDRLGDDAQAMSDALANIRMAFVSVKTYTGQSAPGDENDGENDGEHDGKNDGNNSGEDETADTDPGAPGAES